MFKWLVSTPPGSIIASLGGLQIRWYGLIMALALLAGIFLAMKLAEKSGIKSEKIISLAFVAAICAILGARLFHVLEEWSYYGSHLGEVYKFWQGGLAFHGVVFGGLVALFFWSKRNQLSILKLLDIVFPALVLGQAIGRWGNWFNQELYGKPTNLPWAIPIQPEFRVSGYENFSSFHPLFLYESLGNLIILIFLLMLWKKKPKTGIIAASYLILSPALRFGLDFLRLNQPGLGNFSYAQVFCLILIVAGFVILFKVHFKKSV
ncbi:MAG: prolipoprotein diacylglyceryl transferase [Candidatus Kerfeldbacteria bacterium CG08_land_8_20_14_0_20_43_14]|uniref:Phosphatidylglycerol--prolipoprotein diacylglyceryl transferase n=1 Tax=Candidatus Kerfeldbacteria bacterium CG08_land_8_20_14_0_20_43_14 TaxID=2014246 RepID=A0A2H0YSP3_9BACT|nr:MAG: prolipoprotein diacylglyceryl transferase [Candidatus Kerfeldbacteria bacterium CG08_land_8_20_14_0_20_43_14]